MKKINKLSLTIMIISLILTATIYPNLPDTIPQHFGPNGKVDAYGHKYMVFITGSIPIIIYFLIDTLRLIDPKKESYKKHEKAYTVIKLAISIFFIIIQWSIIFISLGYNLSIPVVMSISIGIMFIIMGNYMTQLRENFFMGIKNPWTLTDSNVWRKTHRVGGYTSMLLGVIAILCGLIAIQKPEISFIVFISMTIIWALGINIYSYIIYKRLHR